MEEWPMPGNVAHTTVLMVAWGMVGEMEPDVFRAIRSHIRDELRPYKLKIKNDGRRAILRQLRPNNQARSKVLHVGSLRDCCKRALCELEPENYPLSDFFTDDHLYSPR